MSGVDLRLSLVGRSEVDYRETGSGYLDLSRLGEPTDGHMDEVHALRDRLGADLVSLMVAESDICGRAYTPGAFSLTRQGCAFVHELGHNFGLLHDRYTSGGGTSAHPAYGYVNQRAFAEAVPPSRRWGTMMAYSWRQCGDSHMRCNGGSVSRFSN